MAPFKNLESAAIAMACQVLSTAEGQERKRFVSPYDTQLLMADGYLEQKRLHKVFDDNYNNIDYIMLPIYETLAERAKTTDPFTEGHWFLVIVNIKDKQFNVIDSFRKPNNKKLIETTQRVRAKIINLWNRVTMRRDDCKVKDVWSFPLKFFEGFKQLDNFSCGIFTIKAMECWGPSRILPKISNRDCPRLRRIIVHQWLSSPQNTIDYKTLNWDSFHEEYKFATRTGYKHT